MESAKPPVTWRDIEILKWKKASEDCHGMEYAFKNAWEVESAVTLQDALLDEFLELVDALKNHVVKGTPVESVILECVDVANVAMMLACQLDPDANRRRRGF